MFPYFISPGSGQQHEAYQEPFPLVPTPASARLSASAAAESGPGPAPSTRYPRYTAGGAEAEAEASQASTFFDTDISAQLASSFAATGTAASAAPDNIAWLTEPQNRGFSGTCSTTLSPSLSSSSPRHYQQQQQQRRQQFQQHNQQIRPPSSSTFLAPSYTSRPPISSHQFAPSVIPSSPCSLSVPSFSPSAATSVASSLSAMNSPNPYGDTFFSLNSLDASFCDPTLDNDLAAAADSINTTFPVAPTGWDNDFGIANDPSFISNQAACAAANSPYNNDNSRDSSDTPSFFASTLRNDTSASSSVPLRTPSQPVAELASRSASPGKQQNINPLKRQLSTSDQSSQPRKSIPSPPRGSSIAASNGSRERGRCPYPGCGRAFKDLKAHILTHQSERPEKCPIVTCEYHHKGFARKYDKNRHTLTHYRGIMVCGFCPGSGTPAETSFNRADVFKRHLVTAHGVEQTAPNSRKKTPAALDPGSRGDLDNYGPDATGKCSTCGEVYGNAQDFYEHLDDCVLRAVYPQEECETFNTQNLSGLSDDEGLNETFKRNSVAFDGTYGAQALHNDGNKIVDESSNSNSNDVSRPSPKSGYDSTPLLPKSAPHQSNSPITATNNTNPRRPKSRRDQLPPAWGCPPSSMKAKRRLLCVFDGPRRLWKDEMLLDNEFEVRLRLPHRDAQGRDVYVTDLDMESLKRAEGVFSATEEEKGPWRADPATSSGDNGRSGNDGFVGKAAVGCVPWDSSNPNVAFAGKMR